MATTVVAQTLIDIYAIEAIAGETSIASTSATARDVRASCKRVATTVVAQTLIDIGTSETIADIT